MTVLAEKRLSRNWCSGQITTTAARGFFINKEGLLYSLWKLKKKVIRRFLLTVSGEKWFFLEKNPTISQKSAKHINQVRALVAEEKIRMWFTYLNEILGDGITVVDFKRFLILAEKEKSYDVKSTFEKDFVTTLIAANAAGHFAFPLTICKHERIPTTAINAAPLD
ncbi:hypothetical protein ILUMI_15961 [Ignelater luminosus]|uniref:Uncharacterized protein n=1 Tax=Ignelater luminosus TaxID=2038154 RepID=A0A8K0CTT6_IGNLU|nr:hypothetical protein ILUMI_15961 [Ignelater luminosus]